MSSTSTPTRSTRRSAPASSSKASDKSQLPSPPSSQEDSLLNNKRKRHVSGTPNPKLRLQNNAAITTPNPKPRKQHKLVSSPAIESPTKHRARTPATRYEPPRERFTPPREITLSPPKLPHSRSANSKGKMVVQIKHEMPDIDLSLPLPPPSPTDDPILLHGRPRKVIYDIDNATTTVIEDAADIPQPVFTLPDADISRNSNENNDINSSPTKASTSHSRPSSSPNRPNVPSYFDFSSLPEQGPSDSDMTDDEEESMPVFSLAQPISPENEDNWSSDESEVEEGEGEYTGTFHMFTAPIKADPPTSATKARMEEWDAKVRRSPHPKAVVQYSSSPSRSEASRVEMSRADVSEPDISRSRTNNTLPSLSEDEDDRLPPSDDIDDGHPDEPEDQEASLSEHRSESGSVLEYADDDPPERQEDPRTPSPGNIEEGQTQLPSPPSSPLPPPFEPTAFTNAFTSTPHFGVATAGAIRPEFDFSTFETPGTIASTSIAPHDWAADQASAEEEEVEEEDNPITYDPSLIEITSSDPFAAARATAILKAHDYECFTRSSLKRSISRDLEMLKKNSRRRDLSSAAIRKSPLKSPRKAVGIKGDRVYFEGSPMRTLPDLLNEAEEEVSVERSILHPDLRRPTQDEEDEEEVNLFCTPPPRRAVQIKRQVGGEWSKDDWKALDSCFTDERLALGSEHAGGEEVLADADDVDLAAVVKRFADLYAYDLDDFPDGPWSGKGLIKRATALRSKQRSGKGAPPTHPRRSFSSFSFRNESPALEVPDFTPSARRFAKRPLLPGPSDERNPFAQAASTMPKSLLAPRYSHLLDEARAVSFSMPSPAKDEPSEPSLGLGKKVKGLIYSYLKSVSPGPSSSAVDSSTNSVALPPPPPLNGPRGPINTPVRPPLEKLSLPHVDLNHTSPPAPLPVKTKEKPKRLIDLNHVPTPAKTKVAPAVVKKLERKGSVKDLVKSFEERSVSGSFEEGETRRMLRELKEEKRPKGLPVWRP